MVGEDFVQNQPCSLILGDNIYHGRGFTQILKNASNREEGATVFAYQVRDPERYGIVEIDSQGNALSIEEKPEKPKSHFAVTGLYFYDEQVTDIAKNLKPSKRGELEITDLNRVYLEQKQLKVEVLGRGFAWLDTGTHDSFIEATDYVHAIQNRQGLRVGCPEEIAWRNRWINDEQLVKLARAIPNEYGSSLMQLLEDSQ